MYADNARNRMLIVMMAFLVAMSMGLNIKQLFDVSYYKSVASQAQEAIEDLLTIKNVGKDVKVKNVNPTELKCLAENIYFEAATQSMAGKMAVGYVVLNRMSKPNYPKTACGVVNQRTGDSCMFSWTCTDSKHINNQQAWKQSQAVAYDLLSKDRKDQIDITDGATHFHNASVKPGWKLRRVAHIDDHYFYK